MNTPQFEIYKHFIEKKVMPSDINEHLQTLYEYAKKSHSVLECGVRSGVSTWAFAAGLSDNESTDKILVSCDTSMDGRFNSYSPILKKVLTFSFFKGNDLNYPDKGEWVFSDEKAHLEKFDLIFIDTWHVYGHMKKELEKFASMCNKYIIMHDTTVDAYYGESLRLGLDIKKQCVESGIPPWEIARGIWDAIEEFVDSHESEFRILERYTNNNGLTILEKINGEII